jgi:hypothetical protein
MNSKFSIIKTWMIGLMSAVTWIAGLVNSPAALASNSPDVPKALADATVLELPAKAASLVAGAPAADQQNVAIAVVKAAIGLKPSSAVNIVSALARENPVAAPVAAVTAATLQHKRIDQITKAAVAAAPVEVAKIVAALIKEFPKDYGVIAVAAAEAAPSAGREILAVVGECVPVLRSYIQRATAKFAANDGNVPVQVILIQSYNEAATSGAVSAKTPPTLTATASATDGAASLSPATIDAPYAPPPVPTPNIVPRQTTGGRNYSSP